MIAPLAFAVLAAAVPIAHPDTPEASCDEQDLTRMYSQPPKESPRLRGEVDRRIALTLLAERNTAEQATAAGQGKARLLDLYLPLGLALLALAGVGAAAGGKRRGLAMAMVLLALGAGALYARGIAMRVGRVQRITDLKACRLRLLEARSQLEHNELARCVGDMAETDEDLMAFESMLRAGKPIPLAGIQKLRSELNHR